MPQTSAGTKSRAAAHHAPQKVHQQLGGWQLVERVSSGELTELFRARAIGRPESEPAVYALKVLHPRWQEDPRAVRLMQREALVGRTVSHPHVVSVLDSRISQPPQFVVMPWLEGRSLRQRMAGDGRLPAAEALWIARQAAEGLDALYRADGHVTLLDLGFAQRAEESSSAVERCVLGTCAYLAPEYVVSTLRADIRSDIYSLGAVLFEMLAGQPPFSAQDLAELAAMHLRTAPVDVRQLAPRVPEAVAELVRAMLAKNPLRRPQTPGELVDRLVRLELDAFCRAAG